jgi:hypothetical protein
VVGGAGPHWAVTYLHDTQVHLVGSQCNLALHAHTGAVSWRQSWCR